MKLSQRIAAPAPLAAAHRSLSLRLRIPGIVWERPVQLTIPALFTPEECADLRARAKRIRFVDGRTTAGWHARQVKHNQQAVADDPIARAILAEVRRRLLEHPVFVAATRPKTFASLLLSRTTGGGGYGRHVDDALMGGVRTDVSFTLFLSDPHDYEGGALVIEDPGGEVEVRLEAGSLYLYPATTLHRVAPVTAGARLAVVGWVRSHVRDPACRELLFDLERARRLVFEREGKGEAFDLLSKTLANLLRRWAED